MLGRVSFARSVARVFLGQLLLGICPSRRGVTQSRSLQSNWACSVMGLQRCRCRWIQEKVCGASEKESAFLPEGRLPLAVSNCWLRVLSEAGAETLCRGLVSVGVKRRRSENWGILRPELGVGLQRNGLLAFAAVESAKSGDGVELKGKNVAGPEVKRCGASRLGRRGC